MKIKIGDTVILNAEHIMEGTTVTITARLPSPSGEMWEAIVVDGTARTWIRPDQVEKKL